MLLSNNKIQRMDNPMDNKIMDSNPMDNPSMVNPPTHNSKDPSSYIHDLEQKNYHQYEFISMPFLYKEKTNVLFWKPFGNLLFSKYFLEISILYFYFAGSSR